MMLGKRARPPVKRTTSMTEFTLDFTGTDEGAYQPSDPHNPFNTGGWDQRLPVPPAASPRPHRRNSADFLLETAHFLRVCSLCQRSLIPGRDIYMYRGDSAFCSLECRQQQMTQDEWKDKGSLASKKDAAAATTSAGPQDSPTGGTVAAV